MENKKEDTLIEEFNDLVSEISKSVFDKSIYRDLKLTEENLIKTLTSTSEKTATINRNNLISLQNNIQVILDKAIEDFNLGVKEGEENFEKKASKFLNNLEELTYKSKENIHFLKEEAEETSKDIEKLKENLENINKSIGDLSKEQGIQNIALLKNISLDLKDKIGRSNLVAKEHIEALEEIDKMLKGECLKIMNSVNKLENRLKLNKFENKENFLGLKEYIGEGFEDINSSFESEFKEVLDLLEEGNISLNASLDSLNHNIEKYNLDLVDSTRRLSERINLLEKKINGIKKEEDTSFREELKREMDRKYYILLFVMIVIGLLAIFF